MDENIPISYIRIWARKNECSVDFDLKSGDSYRIDAKGVLIKLPDGAYTSINIRHIFPVVDRYPCLRASDLKTQSPGQPPALVGVPAKRDARSKRARFDEIRRYVDQQFEFLVGVSSLEKYVAIRATEAGVITVSQLKTALSSRQKSETLGAALLRLNFCTWDKILATCLDFERSARSQARSSAFGFELSGEILVALGKVSRTQLEYALSRKRQGSKPLGEILIRMGACSASDIDACVEAQELLNETFYSGVNRLGELLVQSGRLTREALQEVLRLQKLGRQPLHAVLVQIGACSKASLTSFKKDVGLPPNQQVYDEDEFAAYLLQRGIINQKQLEEAQNIQSSGHQVLGEILIQTKRCVPEDIELGLNLQRHHQRLHPETNGPKLGDILVTRRLVDAEQIDSATQAQALSKEQLGTTLVKLGVCTSQDFADALQLQMSWREELKGLDYRLGQEMVKAGLLDPALLDQALQKHHSDSRPLGQLLVEQRICPPEAVIDALLGRDERRRKAFQRFLDRVREKALG